tara:strand:- start:25 stop:333 length:309 start_codon:yes stop_codon:yes gene_type:complete
MDAPTIITNNHERYFKYGCEVPQPTLDWYNWLDEDSKHDGWICYRGHWSHISDYLAIHNPIHNPNPPEWLKKWDGAKAESLSVSTLIKVSDDGETYRIATCY